VSDEQLARAFAAQLGLDFVDPTAVEIPAAALTRLPRAVARDRGVFPVGVTAYDSLVVALSDPYDDLLVADLTAAANCAVDRVVATAAAIAQALETHLPDVPEEPAPAPPPEPEPEPSLAPAGTAAGTVVAPFEADDAPEPAAPSAAIPIPSETTSLPAVAAHLRPDAEDEHWTVLLAGWLGNAVAAGGTEAWMVPAQGQLKLETRVRGVWREVLRLPDWTADPLRRRLLAAAGAGAFAPRDELPGRVVATSGRDGLSVCFHPNPARSAADSVHLQLNDPALQLTLAQAGLGPDDQRRLRQWTAAREGLIFLVGSADSGLSTTARALAAWLSARRPTVYVGSGPLSPGSKAATIPRGVGAAGLDAALGGLDPAAQVLVVDDVDDADEATRVLPLAVRGRVVIAATHAPDVAAALADFRARGVPEHLLFGEQLIGVLEQRAVPLLCPSCGTRGPLDRALATRLGLNTDTLPAQAPVQGAGCHRCGRSGLSARRPIFTRVEIAGRVAPSMSDERLHQEAARARKVQPAEQAVSLVVQGLASLDGLARALGVTPPRRRPLVSVEAENWSGQTVEETVAGDLAPTLELDAPIENLATGLMAEGPARAGIQPDGDPVSESRVSDDAHVLLAVATPGDFPARLRRALPRNLYEVIAVEDFEGALQRVRKDRATAVLLSGNEAAPALISSFRDELSSAFLPLIAVVERGQDATTLLEAGADEPLIDGDEAALRRQIDDLIFKLA